MKGKLEKTIKGQWVVRVISEETPECDTIIEHGKQLPVHPDYVKFYFLDEDADGGEVEFEIVTKLWGTNDDIISYAKLIKPKMGNKVDLQKLEDKLDKILADETPESFHDWLERKTGPIRSYHSPKVDEMLKEIEEDKIREGSIFDFVCEDPNCPHCEEDRRQMEDDEYPELDGTNELCNDKIWDDIYNDYTAEQYPAFGGPFTDSISFIDWLKLYYKSPEKK